MLRITMDKPHDDRDHKRDHDSEDAGHGQRHARCIRQIAAAAGDDHAAERNG
ncbi:hypothetical protein SDC9_132209 [bioreactor metagenome]|uniref:Uncharacterized protein n=1 Tax=bioreactor metagenome TaxID=1076179 RepID=A0A645D940_9ZZZZ